MYSPTISIKIETAEKLLDILQEIQEEPSDLYASSQIKELQKIADAIERSIHTLEAH